MGAVHGSKRRRHTAVLYFIKNTITVVHSMVLEQEIGKRRRTAKMVRSAVLAGMANMMAAHAAGFDNMNGEYVISKTPNAPDAKYNTKWSECESRCLSSKHGQYRERPKNLRATECAADATACRQERGRQCRVL